MLTPEALARAMLPEARKALDAGKSAQPATLTWGDIHALCCGLIWLAEGSYPSEWLSSEAVEKRSLQPEQV